MGKAGISPDKKPSDRIERMLALTQKSRPGKLVAAYIPGMREPDLMVKMAHHITTSWDSIELWLRVPLEL
jgi:hypothetical protein